MPDEMLMFNDILNNFFHNLIFKQLSPDVCDYSNEMQARNENLIVHRLNVWKFNPIQKHLNDQTIQSKKPNTESKKIKWCQKNLCDIFAHCLCLY